MDVMKTGCVPQNAANCKVRVSCRKKGENKYFSAKLSVGRMHAIKSNFGTYSRGKLPKGSYSPSDTMNCLEEWFYLK